LFLIVGPSGAGKDTLLPRAATAHNADIVFVRRIVTRPPSGSVVAEARARYSRAFVVPLDMLRARLMMRGRNSDIDVAGRLSRALWFGETLCPDHVIVNVGAIDAAAAELAAVIGAAAD
jgi:ribose 1,5-bisphosphokinase PhnN